MIVNNVALVIVTYNRVSDLRQCISAARCQTFLQFDIIVVNNGSSDGTKEYLDSLSDIVVINQENLGGAGGFYAGQKYMFDNGYEWLWMMDDDGIPDKDQLANLLQFSERTGEKFLNALVLNKDDHKTLSFSAPENWDTNDVDELKSKESLIGIHPFNGTFIHRSVIEKVGFIKKEMFIWGDEQEYTKRIASAGFAPTTVTSAIHYHPKEKGTWVVVLPYLWKKGLLIKPKHLSHIFYRNSGYISKTYNKYPWLADEVKYNVVYWLRKFDFPEVLKFLVYYWRGVHNRYD